MFRQLLWHRVKYKSSRFIFLFLLTHFGKSHSSNNFLLNVCLLLSLLFFPPLSFLIILPLSSINPFSFSLLSASSFCFVCQTCVWCKSCVLFLSLIRFGNLCTTPCWTNCYGGRGWLFSLSFFPVPSGSVLLIIFLFFVLLIDFHRF